jgi:alpha-tubulin suppressor-like RCC1 family protein
MTVVITTDVSCKDAPSAGVVVGSLGEIEHRPSSSVSTICGDSGELGSLVIVPSGEDDALAAFKVVEGFAGHSADDCIQSGDYSECIVARRALHFLPHTPLFLLCWGDNSSDQLGRGGSGSVDTTPGPTVSPPANPAGVVADTYAACQQTANGDLYCWGYQTGLDAEGRDSSTSALEGSPQHVFPAGTREVVMTGSNVACWSSSSAVSCAGDNTSGQLGVGDTIAHTTPVTAALPASTVLGIATQGRGACALLKDTSSTAVWCWGANDHGEVDVNDATNPIPTPRKKDLSPFPAVVDIASSQDASSHICALLADTSVVCWGSNSDGQLGRSPVTSAPGAPARVVRASDGTALTGVTKLSLGYGSSCAIAGGKVACWGSNSFGQLGRGGTPDGGFDPRASADFVVGLTQVTSLAVGFLHACAVVGGTDVWCWGDNAQGGVGSPSVGQSIATPFHVLP